MGKFRLTILFLLFTFSAKSQIYFPPIGEGEWEITKPDGLSELSTDPISFYPNPANDRITMTDVPIGARWSIIDLFGRDLKSRIVNRESQSNSVFDLSEAQYIIRVQREDSQRIALFLKQ